MSKGQTTLSSGKPQLLPVRQADPRGLRDITCLVATLGPMKHTKLLNRIDEERILQFNRVRQVSRSRKYHYLVTLRCMRLLQAVKGLYSVTEYGDQLARVARYKDEKLNIQERVALAEGLFRCEPVVNVLSLFMPEKRPTSRHEFVTSAEPIRMANILGGEYEFIGEKSEPMRITTMTQANAIRWGVIKLCEQIGVIDRIILPRGHLPLSTRGHIFFPVNIESEYGGEDLVDDLMHLLKQTVERKLSVPDVIQRICFKRKISREKLQSLLEGIYSDHSDEFYFERVPKFLAQTSPKAYLRIAGQYRSAIYLTES